MIGDVSLLVHPFFALFNLMEYKELSPDESKHSKKYTLHVLWLDCNFAPA